MSNFEQIRGVIMSSSINSADKMAMVDMFADISDAFLADPAELIVKDPSWIEKLNDNRKKKHQAFTTNDTNLLKEILQEEKHYLQAINYDHD